MADQQRQGHSSSTECISIIRQSPNPSAHQAFNSHANALGSDPSLLGPPISLPTAFDDQHTPSTHIPYDRTSYLEPRPSQQYTPQPDDPNHIYLQDQVSQADVFQDQAHFDGQTSDIYFDSNQTFENLELLDPSFLVTELDSAQYLNPSVLEAQEGNNNAEEMGFSNGMATIQHRSPSPHPHFPTDPRHYSTGSVHTTPAFHQNTFSTPRHSRQSSLAPASAQFLHQESADFSGQSFYGHRRNPSDNHSDISSSAHPSPYLGHADALVSVDHRSPMLDAQHDPGMYDALGLSHFSLSDAQVHQQRFTPEPSPHVSPRLMPQQQDAQYTTPDSFGVYGMENQLYNSGVYLDSYPGQGQDGFPAIQQSIETSDFVGAEHMSPPEINIDFAPPAKQASFTNMHMPNGDGLTPPERTKHRARAISDVTNGSSRGTTPIRSRSPSLGVPTAVEAQARRSMSRSGSPAALSAGINKHNRRSSTSSMPHDAKYMISLARHHSVHSNPDDGNASSVSPPSQDDPNGGELNKKGQKHPATFSCHLCTKKFTRGYNLRSHLRTHTDERPFLCTVCGKAFARQHDRKRHEGLHSGEKKFVCRGQLAHDVQGTSTWGCGRRFARADALGRHFRSEAGRACIKPLLDEEARERQTAMLDQATQEMLNQQIQQHEARSRQSSLQPPTVTAGNVDYDSMPLPAALLQMYPALARMQWDTAAAGVPGDEEEFDASGRSSFDVSDTGEFVDDDQDNGYNSGLDHSYNTNQWSMPVDSNGWMVNPIAR